jgi:hypothetical protein
MSGRTMIADGKIKKPMVFGEVTPREAEDYYRFGTIMTLMLPGKPEADFDLPGRPPEDRQRFNEIAQRWREAYIGNYLREDGPHRGDNWLIFDCGDFQITSDHVHCSDMESIEDIAEFVINAPDDMKWLMQMVLDLTSGEEGEEEVIS